MSVTRTIIGLTAGILALAVVIIIGYNRNQAASQVRISPHVTIEKTWELPKELREVSGIAFLGQNRIACVQDEEGIIYIFDLESSGIEQEIDFAGSGDYEGISVRGTTAYVLESDGSLFIIEDFLSKPQVREYETPLTRKQDVEGLAMDHNNNRLLLALKGKDPRSGTRKGVYEFDLERRKLGEEPVWELDMEDPVFDETRERNPQNTFRASEIHTDPATGGYVLLQANTPQILILDRNGAPRELHMLDGDQFPQPEGLTFDTSGSMYISNEGKPATIHKVLLQKTN